MPYMIASIVDFAYIVMALTVMAHLFARLTMSSPLRPSGLEMERWWGWVSAGRRRADLCSYGLYTHCPCSRRPCNYGADELSYVVMVYVVVVRFVVVYAVMTYGIAVMAHVIIVYVVMTYVVMVFAVMTCVAMAYVVTAYVVMAYEVMECTVTAYIIMVYADLTQVSRPILL